MEEGKLKKDLIGKIEDTSGRLEKLGITLTATIHSGNNIDEIELKLNGNAISYRSLNKEGINATLHRLTLLDRLADLKLLKGVK